MRGIILAGGRGTRLSPVTTAVSKQLLPVHDKPMIYYPLSVLMTARIREVLIISTVTDLPNYKRLLGDGSKLGMNISYLAQENPNGIAEAFIISEKFINNEPVALILGDNIFYGFNNKYIYEELNIKSGAKVFSYKVSDPENFGVVEFSENGSIKSIEEKPKYPKSNNAVVGLYAYDNKVVQYAKTLKPSKRGELEITDLNNVYRKNNELKATVFKKGVAWLDTGTFSSLLEASHFINMVEKRQGVKVGCIEEVAYENHWISKKNITEICKHLGKTDYTDYLLSISKKK